MEKSKQTPEVKEQLYKLTLQFVRKYQPRYYKQYRGDLEDLASDFFCQFLTPKSRIEGKEESLLDKFDLSKKPPQLTPEVFFANLVKVSVQRMLIDRSRRDCYRHTSIDKFIDEYGDLFTKTFQLTTEADEELKEFDVDNITFSKSFLDEAKSKYNCLSASARKAFTSAYNECREVLSGSYRKLFDYLLAEDILYLQVDKEWCPVQQVTSKTAVLFIPSIKKMVDFDRFTGVARGKYEMNLSLDSIAYLSEIDVYKQSLSRIEFCNKMLLQFV